MLQKFLYLSGVLSHFVNVGGLTFLLIQGDRQLTFVLIRVGFTFCRSSRWGWLVINNQHGEDRQSTFHSPCEFLIIDHHSWGTGCWCGKGRSTIDMERIDNQYFTVHVNCWSLIIDPGGGAVLKFQHGFKPWFYFCTFRFEPNMILLVASTLIPLCMFIIPFCQAGYTCFLV